MEVRVDGKDVDLVTGDPLVTEIAEAGHSQLVPVGKSSPPFVVEPRVGAQPRRVGEVVQRHEGAQTPIADRLENRAVVRNGRFVNRSR
ncbi:unannotated protein [freshwater metagenome]|uniref:Unannotated protein n=1 Tax=freshwater metagenome TaxID=449393 RepID=A0A6J6X648_9ZZZZ